MFNHLKFCWLISANKRSVFAAGSLLPMNGMSSTSYHVGKHERLVNINKTQSGERPPQAIPLLRASSTYGGHVRSEQN